MQTFLQQHAQLGTSEFLPPDLVLGLAGLVLAIWLLCFLLIAGGSFLRVRRKRAEQQRLRAKWYQYHREVGP